MEKRERNWEKIEVRFLNKEIKLFLTVFLVLSIGFLSSKLNITGNVNYIDNVQVNSGDTNGQASLYVDSDPDGASVYISNSYAGQTPLTLESLNSNQNYNILFKKVLYYDITKSVNLDPVNYNEIKADLTKIGEGNLNVNSNIKEAEIYIENEYRGNTPKKISLPEGIYDLKIRKDNYLDYFLQKSIKAGQNENLLVNLENIEHGNLYVETNPNGAKIFVDETYQGYTPSLITLTKGTHEIKIVKESYDTENYDISLDKDERKDLILILDHSLGTLFVSSEPLGSKIYVDGNYQGVSPKIVSGLSSGPHTLKLSKEYYSDYLGTVNIKRLYPNNIYVSLERK